jgi:hypothetical protein
MIAVACCESLSFSPIQRIYPPIFPMLSSQQFFCEQLVIILAYCPPLRCRGCIAKDPLFNRLANPHPLPSPPRVRLQYSSG